MRTRYRKSTARTCDKEKLNETKKNSRRKHKHIESRMKGKGKGRGEKNEKQQFGTHLRKPVHVCIHHFVCDSSKENFLIRTRSSLWCKLRVSEHFFTPLDG